MKLFYFGTDLDSAGHYFFELGQNVMHKNHKSFGDFPFNPERLPHRIDFEGLSNGTVKFYSFAGYVICAIEGSCKDKRPGSKSIFFTNSEITFIQLKNLLLNTTISKKIIDQMPFEVQWPDLN